MFLAAIRYPIIFFTILCSVLYAQETVAVLDFKANGVADYEAETLTERLRSEIAKTETYRLVDRKLLDKIMQEQALQQSGCTTDECAAEVGELLGVQFMINGSIGKLGNTFTIDIKLVSVTTGAAERSQNISFKGPIEGMIVEMEILAWEIVGLEAPAELLAKRAGPSEDAESKITVAVLDFEPRGISQLEAQTLTDRFSTEITSTNRAILVARNAIGEIMQEQGYSEAECTSEECAAEIGALLGVEFMISGAIGKLGDTYTIDAKMFEVATGAAEKTINTTYTGPVDGLITEIEILAWKILGLDPPSELMKKRKGAVAASDEPKAKTRLGALIRSTILPGWGQLYSGKRIPSISFLGSAVALGVLASMSHSDYQASLDDFNQFYGLYHSSSDPGEKSTLKGQAQNSHAQITNASGQVNTILYALAGVWVANIIHAAIIDADEEVTTKNKISTSALGSGED
ncbi:MAG: hypothetical protein CMG08_05670 [Candidatus Marinimicrobia bacterium]|nr:hypothetical protein [Candidatus Neomarinimicrobiota bacterium]